VDPVPAAPVPVPAPPPQFVCALITLPGAQQFPFQSHRPELQAPMQP
jgi:hypothetical protein